MKRTSIFLDPAIERDLQAIARRRRAPVASVVREALTRYVVAEKEAGGTRPRFVAAGRSGSSDIAERHEEMLFATVLAPAPRKPRRRPTAKRR